MPGLAYPEKLAYTRCIIYMIILTTTFLQDKAHLATYLTSKNKLLNEDVLHKMFADPMVEKDFRFVAKQKAAFKLCEESQTSSKGRRETY